MACLSLISGGVLEHELYHSLFCLETKGLNFYTTPISQPLATSHSPGEGVMTFLFPGTPIGSGQVPKERGSCELLLEVNTRSECGALEGTGSPSLEKERDSDSTASEGKWPWWFQSCPSSRSRFSRESGLPSAVPFGSLLAVLECLLVIFLRDGNRTSKCYRLIWEVELEMFSPQFIASVPLFNGC